MRIDEKRKTMKVFCKSADCKRCPVIMIFDELCLKYKMENAPEGLIEKAYALAFREIKEDKQMNITADEIRKAALELIEKITTSHKVLAGVKAAEMMRLNELKTQAILGYINGVCALAKRVTGGEENDDC